ncbi:ATP-binding protein [Streptomyces sp. NPDC013172]|uniref:ATP-binding protein n=1 Tax=Streptomyces sp. NPDC013172 TaxID=3155009 RepID=UPI0033F018B6
MGGDPERECCQGSDATAVEETVPLSGDASCIAEARRRTAVFLSRIAAADSGATVSERILGLAQLVASELVTNACKYAPGPILLRLRRAETAVEVEVWDGHPDVPAAERADPHRVGRHGLEIVKAVAADLTMVPEAAGKRITARIDLRSSV